MPRKQALRDRRHHRRQSQHDGVDVVADGGLHRRGATGEGNVHRLHLGDLAEKIFGADMRAGADAGATEGEALLLAVPDELGEVLGRIARMHGDDIGAQRHDRDGAQVIGREAFVLGRGLADRERRGGGEDGVAVGGRGAHRLGGEIAAGAAAIFHHDRMLEALTELLPHQAGDHVGDAPGREGDDEVDVLRRVGLRRRGLRQGGGQDREQERAARRSCCQHGKSFRRRFQVPAAPGGPALSCYAFSTANRSPLGRKALCCMIS